MFLLFLTAQSRRTPYLLAATALSLCSHPPMKNAAAPAGITCAPGMGGEACAACVAGTFSSGGNSSSPRRECEMCPDGTTTFAEGAQSAAECARFGACGAVLWNVRNMLAPEAASRGMSVAAAWSITCCADGLQAHAYL